MPAAKRDTKERTVFGNWSMVHVIPATKWPQTLFFYWKDETMPRFKFTREARNNNWLEAGKERPYRYHSMSKVKIQEWVRLKKPT